jgi:hypothetical protein
MISNQNFKITCSIIFVGFWGILPSMVLGQGDALSAPQTETIPPLTHPRVFSPDNSVTESVPADVVEQNDEAASKVTSSVIPNTSRPAFPITPTPTAVKTPTSTPTLDKHTKKTPTSNKAAIPGSQPVRVTAIPNPAYGDKVIFRVMTQGPATAQIVVYDRFFNKVTELQGAGDRLFDILWGLTKVPEGIYYYQVKVTNSNTGESQILHMQSFAVMKDEESPAPKD